MISNDERSRKGNDVCQAIRKVVETVGDGVEQRFVVRHALSTPAVLVDVYDAVTGEDLSLNFTISIITLDEVALDCSAVWIWNESDRQVSRVPNQWVPGFHQIRVVVIG